MGTSIKVRPISISCGSHTVPPLRTGSVQTRQVRIQANAHAESASASKDFFETKKSFVDQSMHVQSAYIHLPFCKNKCRYCDFPVIAVGRGGFERDGDGPGSSNINTMMEDYIEALVREIKTTQIACNVAGATGDQKDERRPSESEGVPLKTIFFGGGTPSLTPISKLEYLVNTLDRKFGIASDAEISIEADPGTFDASVLRSYKSLGINRVSVGVQAFDDHLLELCGRSHALYDVYSAIEDVYSAGIPSWSLDLISGLPELSSKTWENNLRATVDASPPHVSVYDLQIEKGTPFSRLYRPGVKPLPSDKEAAYMYSAASEVLRSAGYDHYEISNYAKPGHKCLHNSIYWDGHGYYAFGMGAASYTNSHRFTRPKRLNSYLQWLKGYEDIVNHSKAKDIQQYIVPSTEAEKLSNEDILTDTVMLQLRKSDGLNIPSIVDKFKNGQLIADAIFWALERWIDEGHVIVDSEKKVVRLADPQGFLLSNDIISDIFVALDRIQE